MATATEVRTPPPSGPASAQSVDERLAFRGPIRRLLLRPEIGALIGTAGVWIFFWAVAPIFGSAAGTANYLDVAATLGIMAVAVSLLMIGGEFDLSSGAMTGATAMLVIMLSKEIGQFGGAGLNLFIAVPLALAFALMIGWFNGTMVEKTRLPSFIVTLGTFFILIGAKLGFAKLFTDQIAVEGLNEADGYSFWNKIFAASWIRNDHIWEDRDILWTILVIGGVALVAAGVLEMSYRRAPTKNTRGLLGAAVGAVIAFAGFYGLLNSDGVSKNVINGALVGGRRPGRPCSVGLRGGIRPSGAGGGSRSTAPSRKLVVFGLIAVVAGVILAALFNPDSANAVGTLFSDGLPASLFVIGLGCAGVLAVLVAAGKLPVWSPLAGIAICAIPAVGFLMTRQAARAVLFVALAVAGSSLMIVASTRAAATSASAGLAIELLTALVVVGLAFFIRSESTSEKFRTELFSVMLLIALALACSALLGYLFAARTGPGSGRRHAGAAAPRSAASCCSWPPRP